MNSRLFTNIRARFFEWMGFDPEDFPEDALDNCEPGDDDEKIFDMLTNPTKYLS